MYKEILINNEWVKVVHEFDNNSEDDYFENEDLEPCIFYQFEAAKDSKTHIDSVRKGTVEEREVSNV